MNADQVNHMVNRFLAWKLPDNFSPDGGIVFRPTYAEEPMRSRHWPIGTNLLSAIQAEAMISNMLEGIPVVEPIEEPALSAKVRQLVIAAREAWEDATDADALQRLDKALEAFAEAVPYENEPERCAVSGRPIGPNDWHCGNGVLRDQFTMAMLVAGKARCDDMDDLDYLARQCGPLFTGHSIARLLPGAPVHGEPTDDDHPF